VADRSRLRDSVVSLLAWPCDEGERALAALYAPILLFDSREPFEPIAAGYTLFRDDRVSPSSRYQVQLSRMGSAPAHLCIEYAIWWDWDIGHLYELEHVWVYVDEDGRVVRAEASWHGEWHDMAMDGILPLEGDHLVLCSQPGKHALAATPDAFESVRREAAGRSETSDLAGIEGLLITDVLGGRYAWTPLASTLARTHLQRHAFEPAWSFTRPFAFGPDVLVPWEALYAWIPDRLAVWLDILESEIRPSEYRYLRIGHRGAAAYAPHNTLAGMRVAAELGADAVEMDVRLSGDGHLVLSHDGDIRGIDGRIVNIHSSSLEEIKSVSLSQGQRVPTLTEVFDEAERLRLGLYLEIKDGGAVASLAEAICEGGMGNRVAVGSFRPDWVAAFHALAPAVPTSVLFGSAEVDPVALARCAGAAYVHPCWERLSDRPSDLLTPEWLARVRQAGLGIIVWHEERPAVIADLQRLGVDGICSDRPELLGQGVARFGPIDDVMRSR